MLEFQLHIPRGIVTIDLETITDSELAQYGVTLQELYSTLPEPENIFNPDTARARELLRTSPNVITMPEIWELLRIFSRLLGIPPQV